LGHSDVLHAVGTDGSGIHAPLEEAVEVSSTLCLALCAADIRTACQAEHVYFILVFFSYVDITEWHEASAAVLLDHLRAAAHIMMPWWHQDSAHKSAQGMQ
jgi:hypothetical protein